MVMKYGGEYRADRIRGRHLERLAADLGIAPSKARKRSAELGQRVVESAADGRLRLPDRWQDAPIIERVEAVIGDAAEDLRRAAAEPA